MDDNERKREFGKWNYSVALNSPDKDQAARGALILHRLVPAPDHGRGFRRDPETGFVYYSSEWLGDEPIPALVVAKVHKHGKVFEAVVMTRKDNLIVYRSGLGFNARGKADCERWIASKAPQ